MFLGHESQVPKPGDFFSSRMGQEPVVLVRGKDGVIRAFLNSCRHRGMKLCRYDQGNATLFTCSYHGWSYNTEGKLVGVPYFDHYNNRLDRSKWGMIPVAQLGNYKGSIWATWDPDAPPLLDYFGGMHLFLDILLDSTDGTPGGSEVSVGVQKWVIPSNWKLSAENFAGDAYHNISHRSVDLAGAGPSGEEGRRDADLEKGVPLLVGFRDTGHAGGTAYFPPGFLPTRPYPGEVGEWFRAADKKRTLVAGKRAAMSGVTGAVGTVFPNMSLRAGQPRQILVWHPAGPAKTEVWSWFLFDASAPPAVKAFYRDYALRYCGPGGMTERDDMENWEGATEASMGEIARAYPYNYALGLEREAFAGLPEELPLRGVTPMSEENARIFYERWCQWMDASSWAEIGQGDQMRRKAAAE